MAVHRIRGVLKPIDRVIELYLPFVLSHAADKLCIIIVANLGLQIGLTILGTGSAQRIGVLELKTPYQQLHMAWVWLVAQPVATEPQDPIQNPHFTNASSSLAHSAFQVEFKRFCKLNFKSVEMTLGA